MEDPYDWTKVEAGPPDTSAEGAVIGLSNECIIVAGGTIGGAGASSVSSHSIHFLDLRDESLEWKIAGEAFPKGIFFGLAQSPRNGIICAGGASPQALSDSLYRIIFNRQRNDVEVVRIPPLPAPLRNIRAAVHGENLFVLGLRDRATAAGLDSVGFYSRELGDQEPTAGWAELPVPDYKLQPTAAVVPQYNGLGTSLYYFHPNGSVSAYDLDNGTWTLFSHAPLDESVTTAAAAVGAATVFLLSEADVQGHSRFRIYNTITNRWAISDPLPLPATPLNLISDDTNMWIPIFDREGLSIIHGEQSKAGNTLSNVDYGILIGYFVLLIVIGFFFSMREKSTLDYFKGGKRVPGWAMGVSLIVTSLSSISFISLPAKAFATDWLYFATNLFAFVGALLVYFLFLPFFTRLDVTTAYEYLEQRFNFSVRALGGSLFVFSEIFRMGTVTYMPALALAVVTGIDIYVCIIMIGVIATVYTLLGGIEAVIWTDVLQTVIMVAGLLCTIGIVFYRIDTPVLEAMGTAWDLDKLHTWDFSWDFSVVTVWVVFLTLPVAANSYLSNQALFQRLVTTKTPKEAGKGLIVKAVVGPFILLFLFFTGTCLFLFYYYAPGQFNPTISKPDQILPWFIVAELPVGVSGLMIGAIFAASMSSLDSGINSICTVCVTDFYGRFASNYSDRRALRLAKIITLIMGLVGTLVAILIASAGIKTMIDFYYQYFIIFVGSIAGIYMLGFFTARGNGYGAWLGFLVAAGAVYYVKVNTGLIFFTYGIIATSVGMIIGYLVSLPTPKQDKPLGGLTFFT